LLLLFYMIVAISLLSIHPIAIVISVTFQLHAVLVAAIDLFHYFALVAMILILPVTIVYRKKDDKKKNKTVREHKARMQCKSKTIQQSIKMMLWTLFIYIVNEYDKGNLQFKSIIISYYLYKSERQKEYKKEN